MLFNKKTTIKLLAFLVFCAVFIIFVETLDKTGKPPKANNISDMPGVSSEVTEQLTQAEIIYYDKEIYIEEIAKYSDVILPLTSSPSESYISDTLFVGDSNTEALSGFGHLPDKNVLGKHSMDIKGFSEKAYIQIAEDDESTPQDESQSITMLQSLIARKPNRIIINFGTNNAGKGASADNFKALYADAIRRIKAACPDTQIVIAAILPVCEKRDNMDIRQSTIDAFNLSLAQLCREEGCGFLNYPEVFKDTATGYADAQYMSADGIHLNGDGYRLILDYAQKHQYN